MKVDVCRIKFYQNLPEIQSGTSGGLKIQIYVMLVAVI